MNIALVNYKNNFSIYKDVVIASILVNIFVLTTPFFVMNIYDRVVPNFALETLWALSIGIIVVYLFDFIIKFIRAQTFIKSLGKQEKK